MRNSCPKYVTRMFVWIYLCAALMYSLTLTFDHLCRLGMQRTSFGPAQMVPVANLRDVLGILPGASHRDSLRHRTVPEAGIWAGVRTERYPQWERNASLGKAVVAVYLLLKYIRIYNWILFHPVLAKLNNIKEPKRT